MAWGRRADPRRFWVEEVVPGALARRRWQRWRKRASVVFGAVQTASGGAAHGAAVAGLVGLLALLVRPLGGRGIFPARPVLESVGLVLTVLGVASFVLLVGLFALARRVKRWLDSPALLRVTGGSVGRAVVRGVVRVPLWIGGAVLLAGLFIVSFVVHATAQLAVLLGLLHPSALERE